VLRADGLGVDRVVPVRQRHLHGSGPIIIISIIIAIIIFIIAVIIIIIIIIIIIVVVVVTIILSHPLRRGNTTQPRYQSSTGTSDVSGPIVHRARPWRGINSKPHLESLYGNGK
jgi:ABC-type multidrug transport system fused ATPase/permease subunit